MDSCARYQTYCQNLYHYLSTMFIISAFNGYGLKMEKTDGNISTVDFDCSNYVTTVRIIFFPFSNGSLTFCAYVFREL